MKNKYKYIEFVEGDGYWDCYSNSTDDRIGCAIYDKDKKRWQFESDGDIYLTVECMADIIDFINRLKKNKGVK